MWKQAKRYGAGMGAGALGLVAPAFAEVPAGVTTALADIGTDGSTVATTILLAVVAIFAIKFLRKGL